MILPSAITATVKLNAPDLKAVSASLPITAAVWAYWSFAAQRLDILADNISQKVVAKSVFHIVDIPRMPGGREVMVILSGLLPRVSLRSSTSAERPPLRC